MLRQQWVQAAIVSALQIEVDTHGTVIVARRFGMSQNYIKAVLAKTKPSTGDLSRKLGLFYRVGVDFSSERDHTVAAIVNKDSGKVHTMLLDDILESEV